MFSDYIDVKFVYVYRLKPYLSKNNSVVILYTGRCNTSERVKLIETGNVTK